MDPRNFKVYMYATLIMITVLLFMEVAWGCVDCDLNKKAFEKDIKVISVEGDIDNINYDKVTTILEKLEKADNNVYYDKIKTIEPKKVDGQYCYVKIVIKQKGDTIVKEEILECADGRRKFDGPSYWELFAQFYYRDIYTPEYCRYYSRPKHAFKSFGKVCMNKDGEWEVK
tara:strand:- start:106 stop:618 length:513 start_codon:yes stop_codon:yes gene_type:complete